VFIGCLCGPASGVCIFACNAGARPFTEPRPQGSVGLFSTLHNQNAGSRPTRAFTASTHSTAACLDSFESPPTAASTCSFVMAVSPALSQPAINSVNAEPAAIEAVQPRTLKPVLATRPFSIAADSRRMSPQMGFDTSTVIAGGGSSPTLRGLRKCSISSGDTSRIGT
jgi:hypothetical protein